MGMASGNGTPYGLPSIPTERKVGEHSTGKVGSTMRQLKISLRHSFKSLWYILPHKDSCTVS